MEDSPKLDRLRHITAAHGALTYGVPMRKSFATFAFAACALVQPAAAVTFPSLTTIYVGSGVLQDATTDNTGIVTSIHCSNVSGVSVQIRALILLSTGNVAPPGSLTATVPHGGTITFSTNQALAFNDGIGDLDISTVVEQGVVNIEATNSAVFCTAVVLDASNQTPIFMSPLHLVRINPHPGSME